MAKLHPFRSDSDSARRKFSLSVSRRTGAFVAVGIVLATALWSGVHFGLAVPSSYPFEIADWSRGGDYATNPPQINRLSGDIAQDFGPTAGQSLPIALPTGPNGSTPNPSVPPTASPEPTPPPNPQRLELTADRRTASRGSFINYKITLTTNTPLDNVRVTLYYPVSLLSETDVCAGQSGSDVCASQSDGRMSQSLGDVPAGSFNHIFKLWVRLDATPGATAHVWSSAMWIGLDDPLMSNPVDVKIAP